MSRVIPVIDRTGNFDSLFGKKDPCSTAQGIFAEPTQIAGVFGSVPAEIGRNAGSSLQFSLFREFGRARPWKGARPSSRLEPFPAGAMRAVGARACPLQHNAQPKPFVWTAKAANILEKVVRGRKAFGSVSIPPRSASPPRRARKDRAAAAGRGSRRPPASRSARARPAPPRAPAPAVRRGFRACAKRKPGAPAWRAPSTSPSPRRRRSSSAMRNPSSVARSVSSRVRAVSPSGPL